MPPAIGKGVQRTGVFFHEALIREIQGWSEEVEEEEEGEDAEDDGEDEEGNGLVDCPTLLLALFSLS